MNCEEWSFIQRVLRNDVLSMTLINLALPKAEDQQTTAIERKTLHGIFAQDLRLRIKCFSLLPKSQLSRSCICPFKIKTIQISATLESERVLISILISLHWMPSFWRKGANFLLL